jgi:glutamine amidotransferase
LAVKSCVVVDYGIGNVFSVMHALEARGVSARLTRDSNDIRNAEKVILPGVGAFGRAIERLKSSGLDDDIRAFIETERPFLGICVGMQLLMSKGSEFGEHDGLGLIDGTVDKIAIVDNAGRNMKVPIIGWYPIVPHENRGAKGFEGTPFAGLPSESAFYFVHSYSCVPSNPMHVLAQVEHDGRKVVAAVQRDNIMGVQFHPERSGQDGLEFLDTFVAM